MDWIEPSDAELNRSAHRSPAWSLRAHGPGRTARANLRPEDAGLVWNLITHGYHVFPDSLPSRTWFATLYSAFDALADRLASEPILHRWWDSAAERWLAEMDNASYWCGVPPAFKDRATRPGKRDKAYLQYCVTFGQWLTHREPELVQRLAFAPMLRRLLELHFITAELFGRAATAVVANDAALLRRFRPPMRPAPIVIKTIRYNPNARRFGTDPHYDKSAFSLLLHSDDVDVCYRVGRFSEQPVRYSDLVAPISHPLASDAPNHAVLLSGACLREAGVTRLQPSPHSVLPVHSSPRHSVIAFHLIPHLDATSIETRAPFINDQFPSVT